MSFRITKAHPNHAQLISELAMKSKAHWGYSEEFMQQIREELTYDRASILNHPTFIAENKEQISGFYQLVPIDNESIELEALFVKPSSMGFGVGTNLFRHAKAEAKSLHFKEIVIQSDPYAEAFYLKQGCNCIGSKPSLSIPGRMLPLLAVQLI